MDIVTMNLDNKATIRLSGRFDFNDHRVFKSTYVQILQQDKITTLEVDLGDVNYIDSSALGMLLLLREQALAAGKTVALVRPNKTVQQILEIANFGKLFNIL